MKHKNVTKNALDTEEVKIIMLGDYGVGKSALTNAFVHDIFLDDYDPTIEYSFRKHTKVDGIPVFLDILDTAVQDELSMRNYQYLQNGECFIIVCSIENDDIVNIIRPLIEQLILVKDFPLIDFSIVFAINKIDLLKIHESSERILILEKIKLEIKELIKELSMVNTSIIETSAKTRHNSDLIFEQSVRNHRRVTVDNVTILKNVIELDVDYIEECKTGVKKDSKNCQMM